MWTTSSMCARKKSSACSTSNWWAAHRTTFTEVSADCADEEFPICVICEICGSISSDHLRDLLQVADELRILLVTRFFVWCAQDRRRMHRCNNMLRER